jgi:hypothetical protein
VLWYAVHGRIKNQVEKATQTTRCTNLFTALIVALGVAMACTAGAQTQTAGQSDDPRMAGFKGKIAKKYEDSKEDWPVRVRRPPQARRTSWSSFWTTWGSARSARTAA